MAIYDIAGGLKDYQPVQAFQQARSQAIRDDVNRNTATRQQQQIQQHTQEAPLRESNQEAQISANEFETIRGKISTTKAVMEGAVDQSSWSASRKQMIELNPQAADMYPEDWTSAEPLVQRALGKLPDVEKRIERVETLTARVEAARTPEEKARAQKVLKLTQASNAAQAELDKAEHEDALLQPALTRSETKENATEVTQHQSERTRLEAKANPTAKDLRDIQEHTDAIYKLNAVTGTLPDDIGRGDRRTPQQVGSDQQDAKSKWEASRESANMFVSIMDKIVEYPGSTGIGAGLAGVAQATLGQEVFGASGQSAADSLSKRVAGVTPQDLKFFVTERKLSVAQSIKVITGDTSGRYTDTEQRITREALASLELMTTPEEVLGASAVILKVHLQSELREGMKIGKEPRFDLTTDAGTDKFRAFSKRVGLSEIATMEIYDSLDMIQQQGAEL